MKKRSVRTFDQYITQKTEWNESAKSVLSTNSHNDEMLTSHRQNGTLGRYANQRITPGSGDDEHKQGNLCVYTALFIY